MVTQETAMGGVSSSAYSSGVVTILRRTCAICVKRATTRLAKGLRSRNDPPYLQQSGRVLMPPTLANGKVAYLEIPARDIERSAAFYAKVFGWKIKKRGDGSTAFA